MTLRSCGIAAVALAAACLTAAGSEPSITIRLAPGATFPAGAAVDVAPEAVETFDVILSEALAPILPNSAKLRLNGVEIVGYARLSRMARGFRALVETKATNHPYLALSRPENDLRFEVKDEGGNVYRGNWTVRMGSIEAGAALASEQPEPVPVVERKMEAPPAIRILGRPVAVRAARSKGKFEAPVRAEVRDSEGISEVVLYVNGKEVDKIQMLRGFPSRRRGRFRKSETLPGTVSGGSRELMIDIPVPLPNRRNVVRISVTNVAGQTEYETFDVAR